MPIKPLLMDSHLRRRHRQHLRRREPVPRRHLALRAANRIGRER
jgi:hypothetical protein